MKIIRVGRHNSRRHKLTCSVVEPKRALSNHMNLTLTSILADDEVDVRTEFDRETFVAHEVL